MTGPAQDRVSRDGVPGASDEAARPPRHRRGPGRWLESIVGACAILISAVSLYVAINANRT